MAINVIEIILNEERVMIVVTINSGLLIIVEHWLSRKSKIVGNYVVVVERSLTRHSVLLVIMKKWISRNSRTMVIVGSSLSRKGGIVCSL